MNTDEGLPIYGYHIRSTAYVLRKLITIIMALAFTQTIASFLSADTSGPIRLSVFGTPRGFAFIGAITAVVRFFHGNISYLTRTYDLTDHEARARRYNIKLAVDFLFIFLQSVLFCVLAWYQRYTLEFYGLFTILFFLDALWFLVIIQFSASTFKAFETGVAEEHVRSLTNWMVVNGITGIVMLVLVFRSVIQKAPLEPSVPLLFSIIMLNTAIDYILNRRLYFPLGARHPGKPIAFVAGRFSSALQDGTFDPVLRRTLEHVHDVVQAEDYTLHSAHLAEDFGARLMLPHRFVQRDISQVAECDIFLAVLDTPASVGTCIEIGWATFLGKPTFLLLPRTFNTANAPMLLGLHAMTHCTTVFYSDDNELRTQLASALDAHKRAR